MKNRNGNRILSIGLALVMAFTLMPRTAYAVEGQTGETESEATQEKPAIETEKPGAAESEAAPGKSAVETEEPGAAESETAVEKYAIVPAESGETESEEAEDTITVELSSVQSSYVAEDDIDISWYIGHEADGSYALSTAGQLAGLAALVNGTAKDADGGDIAPVTFAGKTITLSDDIDLSSVCHGESSEGAGDKASWVPIGSYDSKNGKWFGGVFDGMGHSVRGLYITETDNDYPGLFGYNIGTIRDTAVYGEVSLKYRRYGGICGYNEGTIENCSNHTTINKNIEGGYAGGICGHNFGAIENCSNHSDIGNIGIYSGAGGICVRNYGTVKDCVNYGEIAGASGGQDGVGGICGAIYEGLITDCYNEGGVRAANRGGSVVGGICGLQAGGTINNCYNKGSIYNSGTAQGYYYAGGICAKTYPHVEYSIYNCYNIGSVTVENSTAGITNNENSWKNCYYLSDNNNSAEKTAAAFHSGEVAYLLQETPEIQMTDAGINVANVVQHWGQDLSQPDSYPELTADPAKRVRRVSFIDKINNKDTYSYVNPGKTVQKPADDPEGDGNTDFVMWSIDGQEPYDWDAPVSEDREIMAWFRYKAPDGLSAVSPTYKGENTGKITGTTEAMEYSTDGQNWQPCTGTEISGLYPGTYHVRKKADTAKYILASDAAVVVIEDASSTRNSTITVKAPVFDEEVYGYATPDAKGIELYCVKNGDDGLYGVIKSVMLSGQDAGSFVLNRTGGLTLFSGTKDTTSYTIQPAAGLEPGTYRATITVTYNGGKTAEDEVTFTVKPAAAAAGAVSVTLAGGTYTYTGMEIKPSLTVKYNDTVLIEGKDYAAAYNGNINAGTSSVTVSAAGTGHYVFDDVTKQFTIAKAVGAVHADTGDITKTYGGDPFKWNVTADGDGALSYTVSGSKNAAGEDAADDSVITVATDGNITIVGAGSAKVHVKAAEGTNHTESQTVSVNITVQRASLTIRVDDKSMRAGEAMPAFSYTVEGLVGTEKLAKNPVLSCPEADPNREGNYAIIAGGAAAPDRSNYHAGITYIDGTLTVKAADAPGTPGDTPDTPGDEPDTPGDEPGTPGDTPGTPDTPVTPPAGAENALWITGLSESGYPYTGSAVTPDVQVYFGTRKLVEHKDYIISYKNNTKAAGISAKKAPSITVKGMGNFAGSATVKFAITKAALTEANLVMAKAYRKGSSYAPIIMLSGNVLKAGTDYRVTYLSGAASLKSAPKDAGDYTLHVEGTGANCIGSFDFAYSVVAEGGVVDIGTGKAEVGSMAYGGSFPVAILTVDGTELEEGKDYEVAFTGTSQKGTATAVFTGKGENFTGILRKTFPVKAASLSEASVSAVAAAYVKGGPKPNPTVKLYGKVLQKDVDYTISYKNNGKIGVAAVTVRGKGNYTGTATGVFYVRAGSLEAANVIVSDVASSAALKMPAVTVFDAGGKKLAEKKDYTVRIEKVDGVPTVTITGGSNRLYAGTVTRTYRELPAEQIISSVKLNKKAEGFPKAFLYTGQEIRLQPSWLTVKAGTGKDAKTLTSDDYEIVGYVNNVEKGTATVIVKGKGEYSGTKTLNFAIKGNTIKKML